MDVTQVSEAIARIEGDIAIIKEQIAGNPHVNVRVNGPGTVVRVGNEVYETRRISIPEPPTLLSLLSGPSWPEAVPSDLICTDTPQDKSARGELLLDMLVDADLGDLRLLDYGCGDGYMALHALDRGVAMAVGYDQEPLWEVEKSDVRLRYTHRRNDLPAHAFDVILLHDVLDHCLDPVDVLHHVASLLAPGGTVYAVCHPWISRHGGHLYRRLNKAYAHLILSATDLAAMGIEQEHVNPLTRPIKAYRKWFLTAGLDIRSEELREEPVDRFLRDDPIIWEALSKVFREEGWVDPGIEMLLSLEFVTYQLRADLN